MSAALSAAPLNVMHPNSVTATGFPCARPFATKARMSVGYFARRRRRAVAGIGGDDVER